MCIRDSPSSRRRRYVHTFTYEFAPTNTNESSPPPHASVFSMTRALDARPPSPVVATNARTEVMKRVRRAEDFTFLILESPQLSPALVGGSIARYNTEERVDRFKNLLEEPAKCSFERGSDSYSSVGKSLPIIFYRVSHSFIRASSPVNSSSNLYCMHFWIF